MNAVSVFALVALSLLGLGYFLKTDPKRRRTAGLPMFESRRLLWPARALLLAPGALLLVLGHWSGLAIWAGTVTVVGWVLAATSGAAYSAFADKAQYLAGKSLAAVKAQCARPVLSQSFKFEFGLFGC